jgi:hypothetical protein
MSDYLPLLFAGEAFSRDASKAVVLAGTGKALSKTMAGALASSPYRFLMALLSGRRVEPSREIPAKSPRVRCDELRQLQALALLNRLVKILPSVGVVDFQRLVRADVGVPAHVVIGDLHI